MDELKPCPFCGGEPKLWEVQFGAEPTPRFWVKCKQCRVGFEMDFFTREYAVNALNKRSAE